MTQDKDPDVTINKGDRVKAVWLRGKPLGGWSLAGAQMKFPASSESVTGTIRHLRAQTPEPSKDQKVVAFLDADEPWDGPLAKPPGCLCVSGHVPIKLEWIVEKLPKKDS